MIKEIKYRGVYQMVEELVERWDPEKPSEFDLDLVVTSVPMWRQKIKSRGFNQAQLMAVALARKWGLTYLEIIERERETKPMYGLNKRERLDNVKNAFRPRENVSEPALAKMSGVILVDDVWTSGATLEECARSIRGKWRVKVLPMAVAR